MTNVIELAKQAGASRYTNRHYPGRPTHTFSVEQLERFATLVRNAYRAELLAGVGEPAINVEVIEHSDGINRHYAHANLPVGTYGAYTADQLAAAVLAARNAAPKQAEDWEWADVLEAAGVTEDQYEVALAMDAATAVIESLKEPTP